ncbi:PAS domain-containing protein [Plastorhodobacter daqingensis]|uniref:PAS domain-containing protein n=1 Tax=Plastorhodobacter daqingensis TaxID=1387281 RepID=A0ABW2UNJ5_9RHOB
MDMMTEGRGAEVLPFIRERTSMRHGIIEEVRAYWEALRQDGQIPLRTQVDPRGIENALEHAFVLERIAPGLARLRVAGMHLNDIMGMEVRGMPLSSLFLPEARDMLGRLLEGVFITPHVAELGLRAPGGIGRPAMGGALLLLPLRDARGEISRALGCLVLEGELGRPPRRLTVTEARTIPLAKPEDTAPSGVAPAAAPAGFAEPAPGFHHAPRPYLRLVKSDTPA